MKFKRILSLLLILGMVAPSLSFAGVSAVSSDISDNQKTGDWVAVSGNTKLTVTEVDETDSGAPDTLSYDRISDIVSHIDPAGTPNAVMVYRPHGPNYGCPSDLLLKEGKSYAVSFYARAMEDVNEAWNSDPDADKASSDNKMTLDVYNGYAGTRIGSFELGEDWAYYECTGSVLAGSNRNFPVQFIFTRSTYGGEDVVPVDIDKVTFTELDASGNKVGNPITPPAQWRTDNGGAWTRVVKAESVYSHIELPTTVSEFNMGGKIFTQTVIGTGLGETVALVGSEDKIIPAGCYKISGSFRLGWFDHKTVEFEADNYTVSDFGNTATLKVYNGATLLGSTELVLTEWSNVTYNLEFKSPVKMSELRLEVDRLTEVDYKDVSLECIGEYNLDWTIEGGNPITYTATADCGTYLHIPADSYANKSGVTFRQLNAALSASSQYTLSFKARSVTPKNASGDVKLSIQEWYMAKNLGTITLTDEWTEFSIPVVPGGDRKHTVFMFTRSNVGNSSYLPIDIAEFALVNNATGEEVITENLITNWHESSDTGTVVWDGGDQFMAESSDFSRADVLNAQDTRIYSADETVLEAGRYLVSGSFRLGAYDITTGGKGELKVFANGAEADSVTLDTEWTDVEFTVDIYSAASLKDIGFAFDAGNTILDYNDISLKCTAAYNQDWEIECGKPIAYNDTVGDGWYLHVPADADVNKSGVTFRQLNAALSASSQYTLSFKARTVASKNASGDGVKLSVFEWYMEKNLGTVSLTDEWTEFSIPVVPGGDRRHTVFMFIRGDAGDSNYLPIDIAGLSLVNNATGEDVITENILSNWHGASSTGTVVWGGGDQMAVAANSFLRVEMLDASDTKIYSADDVVLEAGRYLVSGSFRLGAYDVSTDGAGELKVFANGTETGNVTLGTEWTAAEFTVDIQNDASLKDIGFAFDAGSTILDFKDFSCEQIFTFFDGFTTADGTPMLFIEEEDVGQYLRVPAGAEGTGVTYRYIGASGTVALSSTKEYTLSFKARSMGNLDIQLFSEYWWGQNLVTESVSNNLTDSEKTNKVISLTDEWRDISITFKPAADRKNIVLNFDRKNVGGTDDNIFPFEIACMSIKDAATGDEVLPENSEANWSESVDQAVNWGKGAQYMTSTASFYRAEAPASGVTEVFCNGAAALEPGRYYISGMFRLGRYEPEKGGEDKLYAKLGSANLACVDGSSFVELSTDWKEAVFVINIAVTGITQKDLSFALGSDSVLDMREISYVQIERYIAVSDVSSGIITTLLLMKYQEIKELGYDAPWKFGNKNLTAVNGILNESTGKTGDGALSVNTYIHVYNRDHNMDRIVYENKASTLGAGTYNLSFYARTADYTNPMATGRNTAALMRLFIGDGRTTQVPAISSVKMGYTDPKNANNIQLTSTWTKYSYTFTLNTETPFVFAFEGSGAGYGWCPVDIDGFTLVALNSSNGKPITGENLAVNSNSLIGRKAAGWSAVAIDNKGVSVAIEVQTESEYYSAPIPSDGVTTVSSGAYVNIEPGKYYLTAKVRLGNIDFAKYTLGTTADMLQNDANKANLGASLAGAALKTVDGADTVTVTPEWKTVTFVADVKETVPMKKLKMFIDEAYSLDFDFINFGKEINTEDADAIIAPYIDENGNLILPALPEITEGNLLEGIDANKHFAYWSYGDQTLELKTDENGETYFAASNITSNSLGFTYKPGYKLSAGEYKFSAMVRSSVPGEVTWLRAIVGNKSGAAYVTNEWRLIEFAFEVKEDGELTVKFCGGPRLACVQNYDFKKIRLYDKNYVPFGENLTTGGDFENPLGGTAGWVPAYSKGGTVTRLTDEDGNSYLNVSGRPESHYPVALDLGFVANVGDTFTISYDIRTAVEGEEMTIRAYLGSIATGGTGLNVAEPYSSANPVRYTVTNEWRHVEHTYTATKAEEFILQIKGGPTAEDINDFDIDNVVIMKKEIEKVDPAEYYTTGHFNDETTALNNWKIGWGEGTAVWNKEGDNGYITAKGRLESHDPLYYNGGFITIPGVTYKISYDIRTSNAGDSIRIRPYFGTLAVSDRELTVDPIEFPGMPGRYSISHEWKHVEHTITASGYEVFAVQLRGGPSADENKDFDVDNFKVEIVH